VTQRQDDEHELWPVLWREGLVAISLGWELAVPIFGGVVAGHFLDRWLGTRYIFTIGLLVLGIGIGYYNLARFIQRLDAEGRRNSSKGNEADAGEQAIEASGLQGAADRQVGREQWKVRRQAGKPETEEEEKGP